MANRQCRKVFLRLFGTYNAQRNKNGAGNNTNQANGYIYKSLQCYNNYGNHLDEIIQIAGTNLYHPILNQCKYKNMSG